MYGVLLPQGFSTGLPERLQLALLQTLPGLGRVKMLRPAYAVEYDYLPAHQCHSTLETKKIRGLFFSGQLNGTTGGMRLTGKPDETWMGVATLQSSCPLPLTGIARGVYSATMPCTAACRGYIYA